MWWKNNSLNDSERWKRRMALSCSKKLSALLHGTASKDKGGFNSFILLEQKIKTKKIKNKNFYGIVKPSKKKIY